MKSLLTSIVCLAVVSLSRSASIHLGKCPDVPPQSTLDAAKYLGVWYEMERFPTVFERGNCISANYSLKSNGRIAVDNRYILNGKEHTILGEAYPEDENSTEAILSVQFPFSPKAEYKIVETDYSSYSLVFSCASIADIFNTQFAWILSRTRTLDKAVVSRLENTLAQYHIDVSSFIPTNHTGCAMDQPDIDPVMGRLNF
ncbi:apolipoprotein D-like [Aplysia californica]|uniref:Apolipoprotein D-like n=1 Tax=Aplysia californica TaxID=6500 RepID=A0ABM0JPJ0_APLCA|nr:apolipoprotein D-like [Aplysia californica]